MMSRVSVILALAAMLGPIGNLPTCAKTVTFDAEKCHVDVPDDWTQQNLPGNQLAIVNPDQTKSFILRIVAVGPNLGIDNASFASGVEKSMTANGATITGRTTGTLAGLDARIWDATTQAPAGAVYDRMTVVMANGNAYALNIQRLGGRPSQDDQLNSIVSSFGFIGAPRPQEPKDPMDKVGFYIGVFVGVLAVISIFKWIRNLSRRRS